MTPTAAAERFFSEPTGGAFLDFLTARRSDEVMETRKFADLFWAHYPPEVRKLREMLPVDGMTADDGIRLERERTGCAIELARKGYALVYEIHAMLWDPLITMTIHLQRGLRWLPSLTQDPRIAARANAFDPNAPAPPGAFMLSIDPADWPAWRDPNAKAPVTPPPAGSVVGFRIGETDVYAPSEHDSDKLADGATVTDARGTFRKRIDVFPATPFFPSGRSVTWVKVG